MLQLGEGAKHAALAEVRGGTLGAGAKLLAAGLQLLGQLFQPEQFGRALGSAFGRQLNGIGRFAGVELGVLRTFL